MTLESPAKICSSVQPSPRCFEWAEKPLSTRYSTPLAWLVHFNAGVIYNRQIRTWVDTDVDKDRYLRYRSTLAQKGLVPDYPSSNPKPDSAKLGLRKEYPEQSKAPRNPVSLQLTIQVARQHLRRPHPLTIIHSKRQTSKTTYLPCLAKLTRFLPLWADKMPLTPVLAPWMDLWLPIYAASAMPVSRWRGVTRSAARNAVIVCCTRKGRRGGVFAFSFVIFNKPFNWVCADFVWFYRMVQFEARWNGIDRLRDVGFIPFLQSYRVMHSGGALEFDGTKRLDIAMRRWFYRWPLLKGTHCICASAEGARVEDFHE